MVHHTAWFAGEDIPHPVLRIPAVILSSHTVLQITVTVVSTSSMRPQGTFQINYITGKTIDESIIYKLNYKCKFY